MHTLSHSYLFPFVFILVRAYSSFPIKITVSHSITYHLKLNPQVYYFTNRSLSVEHNDESHESFESSSSLLPNQKLDDEDVDGFDDDDDDDVPPPPLRFERESFPCFADFRKKPSMAFPIACAFPIICGSTNEVLLSQRKRLLDFFSFCTSFSLNRSNTSFENETVTLAVFRSDFLRDIG